MVAPALTPSAKISCWQKLHGNCSGLYIFLLYLLVAIFAFVYLLHFVLQFGENTSGLEIALIMVICARQE